MDNSYVLIGGGGTGSQFIGPALAYLQSWHNNDNSSWEFIIVDGDSYHENNLTRQLFDPRYIGINKADALVDQYKHYPVKSVPKYIGKEELGYLITDGSIVFLGVDNYSVRALVEERAIDVENCVIINAGNEMHDGSVQLWVRENGENKTPRLSYGHPEIKYLTEDDRSAMTCMEAMSMPGGEQLIIANMASAQHMLTALWRYHKDEWRTGWTEINYDLLKGEVLHIDMRERRNWFYDKVGQSLITEG